MEKNEGMKELLKYITTQFGNDINFRVKLSDGRVFKSKDWDKLDRIYSHRRQK